MINSLTLSLQHSGVPTYRETLTELPHFKLVVFVLVAVVKEFRDTTFVRQLSYLIDLHLAENSIQIQIQEVEHPVNWLTAVSTQL